MRVAHAEALPPFAEARDGRSFGIVIDIMRAIAACTGTDMRFIPVPLAELEIALTDGRADAVVPIAITSDRLQRLDFSETLLMTGGSIYVRSPEATPTDLAALTGRTVVTPRTGPLADYIRKVAPDIELVVAADYETSLDMLVAGRVDAAALNHQAGALIADRLHPGWITIPKSMFLELPFAAAVPKGQRLHAIETISRGMATIRAGGTWDRVYTQSMKSMP